MKYCPICGKKIDSFHQLPFKEPFVHTDIMEGLSIYGAYSAGKGTLCYANDFLHFAFFDIEGRLINHTLVQLGVKNQEHYFSDTLSGKNNYRVQFDENSPF